MNYMGSKSRIAKYIVPIIQDYIDNSNTPIYIEPFCGGCNVIDKIKAPNKIAADKNHYLIELLSHTTKYGMDDFPADFVPREHYSDVRTCYNEKSSKYPDWYIGGIGFLSSYNGRFFDGGYAGDYNLSGKPRNKYSEQKRNLEKQLPNLKGITFIESDYKDLSNKVVLKDCVIYCDPPYQGTKQYKTSKGFDYEYFWEWCRKLSRDNIVLISEEQAPDDFECIWEMPLKRQIDAKSERKVAVEKLFKYV